MLNHGLLGRCRYWPDCFHKFESSVKFIPSEKKKTVSNSGCKARDPRISRIRPRLRVVRQTTVVTSASSAPSIMVNSCTGKMGCAAAEAVLRAGLDLIPLTVTGETREQMSEQKEMEIGPEKKKVEFIPIEDRDRRLKELKLAYKDLIIVDFTLPQCVNENGVLYGELGLNFVMGTTGGDRQKLIEDAKQAGVYAVIAPQMGKQVVAFQAMLKYMSEQFPDAFSGYTLSVTESHQASKVDTSGTAKAVIESFVGLGASFDSGINMVRDPEISMKKMGVPEEALLGHAYHTYHLTSPDHSVNFEFQHNVAGRTIYAEGTVDAVFFLAQQIKENSSKKIFNMIDVLEAGSMR